MKKDHHDGHMGKERHMSHKGHTLGEMSPTVDNYQKPHSDFSQEGFSRTLDYIERQDNHQKMSASKIKAHSYSGRYS